jgi:hypothetical protein
VRLFLADDGALLRTSIRFSQKSGLSITPQDIKQGYIRQLATGSVTSAEQESFCDTLGRWASYFDDHLFYGSWNLVHTTPEDPFVIGDNPLITWVLTPNGARNYGAGIEVPGAEVFLPVSPTACLHILPAGHVRRAVSRPRPREVNEGQVLIMTRSVYSERHLSYVDELVQSRGGSLKIGVNCFVPHTPTAATVESLVASSYPATPV